MEKVGVPHEFFVNERNNAYSNWTKAFWRELIQNSIDAGGKIIRVSISPLAPALQQKCRVVFCDDGVGMTVDVLREVFFRLGASTKAADDANLGGFGRARLLTCFSQDRYSVWTGNALAQGVGGEFQIQAIDEFLKGCQFTIDVAVSAERLHRALVDFMSECDPGVALELSSPFCSAGSETLKGDIPFTRCRRRLRDEANMPFGKVAIVPGGDGKILVRARGVAMFSIHIADNHRYVVELDDARKALTSCRDTFREPYGALFRTFCDDLQMFRTRALREMKTDSVIFFGPSLDKCFTLSATKPAPGRGRSAAEPAAMSRDKAQDQPDVETNSEAAAFVPPVVMCVSTASTTTKGMRNPWTPDTWTTTTVQGIRLAETWRVCVRLAIEAAQAANLVADVKWAIGYVFPEEPKREAVCQELADGYLILLNPLNEDGKRAFSAASRDDQLLLMAIACHEVTHIYSGYHSEAFANALTHVCGKFDQKTAFREIADIPRLLSEGALKSPEQRSAA